MKDLISRQAAIDALGERPMVWMDSDYEIAQRNQYDMDKLAIETVPSAQQWISCSERMPEEETDVIVCNANGDIQISRGSYSTEMKDYFIWYTTGWRFGEVIAWMPLPNPYKENKNG